MSVLVVGCSHPHRAAHDSRSVVELPAPTALPPGQQAALARQGVVIAANATATSYHAGYTALFKHHEPVYITADAILHALHTSFDRILLDVERAALIDAIAALVDEVRQQLRTSGDGDAAARADVDLYWTVAATLLRDAPAAPVAGAVPSEAAALAARVKAANGVGTIQLFGESMDVDFSMFKPRGHYVGDPTLERYFRAMMWLSRTEIRIATERRAGEWRINRRALAAVRLLQRCFSDAAATAWRTFDDAAGALVGPRDSMSFPELAAGLASLRGDRDADVVAALLPASRQRIGSQLLPAGEHTIAFIPLGQRYLFDSDVLSAVSYGRLPARRMMPSPLDVASAVFGNPTARRLLAPDLERYHYGEALDTIARAGQTAGPTLWQGSLVHAWLHALAELSPNEDRDASLPAPLRSDAWARRLLQTQLASWAELRHDTLLYAKQSYTAVAICGYPDAYVDPYPEFFAALAALGRRAIESVRALHLDPRHDELRARIVRYFDTVADVAEHLRAIAARERRDESPAPADLDFINHAVSLDGRHAGCTIVLEPGGWYADLHYDRADVLAHRPVIADVHTQPTDEAGNPLGAILHAGAGHPRQLIVTLPTCAGTRTFRGYVASYYEIVTTGFNRLDDETWSSMLNGRRANEVRWLTGIVLP